MYWKLFQIQTKHQVCLVFKYYHILARHCQSHIYKAWKYHLLLVIGYLDDNSNILSSESQSIVLAEWFDGSIVGNGLFRKKIFSGIWEYWMKDEQ